MLSNTFKLHPKVSAGVLLALLLIFSSIPDGMLALALRVLMLAGWLLFVVVYVKEDFVLLWQKLFHKGETDGEEPKESST